MTLARWSALLLWLLLPLGAARAQNTNPTEEDCGLPAGGNIYDSAAYTLNADCAQTSELNLAGQPAGQPGITLTINGAGHTIKLGTGTWSFASANDSRNAIALSNVTIDGQFNKRPVIMHGHNISATGVTFTRNYGSVISSASTTLTNVLFADNRFDGVGFGANGGTLNLTGGSVTVTNAVFRYNRNMNIVLHPGATLTTEGCLTFSGNLAYNVVHSGLWSGAGDWTDSSTGECSGEIGNGDSVAIPAVPLSPCGLPSSLVLIDSDRTFTLRGNCEEIVGLVVSEGKRVTIRGNGFRIGRNASLPTVFRVAGDASLTISDAILDKAQFANYGTLTVTRSEMRNSLHLGLINYGTASFSNMQFQDNSAPAFAGLYYAGAIFLKGIGTFSDSKFDGVSGGDAALRANGSTVVLNLNGCIIFENLAAGYPETLAQGGATLNDNRETAECNPSVGPRPRSNPRNPGPSDNEGSADSNQGDSGRRHKSDSCFQALGAIGLVCRGKDGDEPILEVWEISPESVGSFALGIRQRQVEAAGEGITLCSANERARIRVGPLPPAETLEIWRWDPRYPDEINVPRTYITVSMGPNFEGKVHHVILDHTLEGRVLSVVDTYGRLEDCPADLTAPPQSRMLSGCMVRTNYMLNFRASPDGEVIDILPYDVTLTALERTDGWFKVDYHGARGWISAGYVEPKGNCG